MILTVSIGMNKERVKLGRGNMAGSLAAMASMFVTRGARA